MIENLPKNLTEFIKAGESTIVEYKEAPGGRTRQEINNYIYSQINDDLKTKNNRVRTSLTYLRKKFY